MVLYTMGLYDNGNVDEQTVAIVSSPRSMKVITSIRWPQSSKSWIPVVLMLIFVPWVSTEDYGSIAGEWKVQYGNDEGFKALHLWTSRQESVPLIIYDVGETDNQDLYFEIKIENSKLARVEKRINLTDFQSSTWQDNVTVDGLYFGFTELYVTLNDPSTSRMERSPQSLEVIVKRHKRIADGTLSYTAIAIVLLMFINLGTVLDVKRVTAIFKRPVGPLLGFCSRFIVMPALALGLGALMLKDDKHLQLALFLTAMAPSGGIANICNIFLRGNINLSLATTTVNSILALGMLPFWVYLMGPVLYKNHTFDLPFVDLAVGCIGLCIALSLGVMLRVCIPKTTRLIFRFLKPLSILLSLCLVAVTVGINYFIFREITLLIFLASLCLPAIGYALSFFLSKLLCRSVCDSMTIAVETSVLNMSLPIVLLEFTLDQPVSDMVIVVPITAALVSLCLVFIFYIVRRIFGWNTSTDLDSFDEKAFLVKEQS